MPVGKEFAICPGRGKFAVCRARVTTLCLSMDHFRKFGYDSGSIVDYKESEAHKEGFGSWDALMRFFQVKEIQFIDTFRIEYELVKKGVE